MTTTTTYAELRTAYERALANEHRVVDALPDRATKTQLDRAWAAAEATNKALRAMQAAVVEG